MMYISHIPITSHYILQLCPMVKSLVASDLPVIPGLSHWLRDVAGTSSLEFGATFVAPNLGETSSQKW